MDKVLVDLFFGFSFLVVNFSIFGVLDDGLIKLDENKLLFVFMVFIAFCEDFDCLALGKYMLLFRLFAEFFIFSFRLLVESALVGLFVIFFIMFVILLILE